MSDGTTTPGTATPHSATTADPSIKRILVALDATAESLAALEAAANLAQQLRAELLGLFVEDVNLVSLAGLPAAREIYLAAGAIVQIDTATVERQFRMQKKKAWVAIEKAAKARHLSWSFRVVRGQVPAELLKAASEVDLITLGKGRFPLTKRLRLGSTARVVAGQNHHTFIVAGSPENLRTPTRQVSVAYDGSACAKTALGIALRIAGASKAALTVFLLADTGGAGNRLQKEVEETLPGKGPTELDVRYRRSDASDEMSLVRATDAHTDVLLVVGGECRPLAQKPIQRLLEATARPVLLVKSN